MQPLPQPVPGPLALLDTTGELGVTCVLSDSRGQGNCRECGVWARIEGSQPEQKGNYWEDLAGSGVGGWAAILPIPFGLWDFVLAQDSHPSGHHPPIHSSVYPSVRHPSTPTFTVHLPPIHSVRTPLTLCPLALCLSLLTLTL
jgi:hypothetical protein